MTLTLTPRSETGLLPPKYRANMYVFTNGWFWHWLGNAYPAQMSDLQVLQSAQRYHMNTKGWSDIAYSFAVGRETNADGTAKTYELRGDMIQGGHTLGFNNTSMAIVFLIGEGEKPTPAMFQAARAIMADVRPSDLLRSHRDVGTTACPGNDIAAEIITPQFKDSSMASLTPSSAELYVNQAYDGILGRPADPGGLKFWRDALVEGTWSLENLRWNFLETRLAADKAVATAITKAAQSTTGVDLAVVAEQAYRLFLDDLVALGTS